MKELLQKYAITFSNELEKMTLEENEQRSVNHPVVFLFLGDQVKDAMTSIMQINEEKWHNSSGVLYFHAYQTDTITHENVLSIQVPGKGFERQTIRKNMYEAFTNDDDKLIELNKAFRKLSVKIAEYGKVYSSLIKINLCVVTAISDPANILIQEITLLLKSILQESFKNVEVDLYGLLKERQDENNFAFSTSLGMSFLKELDYFQSSHYSFEKDMQLTEDHLRLPVIHAPSPLFDMVYLLSDKNEAGLISSEASQLNYEIISNLNLLKNRKMITDYHEKMDSYNHQDFKNGIRGNSVDPVYASAGFAKVTRPNKAIALHAASYFFQEYLRSLTEASDEKPDTVLTLLELSESHFQKQYQNLLPSSDKLDDMNGLMGVTHSYQAIKKMSVRDAESHLYEGVTQRFFAVNFEEPVREHLQKLNLKQHIERCLDENIINNEKYGLHCAYLWTSEASGQGISVMNEIGRMLRETKSERLEVEARLEQYYQQLVDHCDFKKSLLPFSDKKNLASFIQYFFEAVYGAKHQLLRLEIKQAILLQYLEVLQQTHLSLRSKIELINQVESQLKQAAAESLYDTDDYLDKNIAEYYAGIIKTITGKLRDQRGAAILSNERFFGNLLSILEGGANALLEKLLSICNREVLTQPEFHRSFEDELLERANVASDYANQEILTKDDLFKQLYQRLYENSAIQIEVFHYSQEHRYEEKYFFGDFYSKFMNFALEKEQETRHFKVGCAHEKDSSGVEKLTLMGGFKLKDLMYYQHGERYYKTYSENGYEFHAEAMETHTTQ
ncbi:tubulin-like doman-containing protein [Neobacillus niacini]|uniref:tubulin-like doman-containing protein n=1 Tax=Neobacillus niacini TaxID=86668 RepID=UPI0021CB5CB9|nr:tubulin-like doman-containing protein [Neobacillus niacini]MCM3763532.1 tubulin-like doman-containing protein [Neobacillus niacini]